MYEFIEPIVTAGAIVRTESVTEFIQDQANELQVTVKIAAGALLTVGAAVGLFVTKGKIGKIIILVCALALGAWLVLGDGWMFGKDKLEQQVNSAPAIVQVIESPQVL